MLVSVSVDSGDRFQCHVDGLESVLLPLAKAGHDARDIAVYWPGYAKPFRRLLRDPEPAGAGFVSWRMESPRVDGAGRD